MTAPRPKNPLLPTRITTLPPSARSRTALGLTSAAAWGRFALQTCGRCAAIQYPPREVCGACLSGDLAWRDVPDGGTVIATTTIRASADPYFRQRLPWRAGLVRLDAGPSVVAHLRAGVATGGVATGDRVTMRLVLDRAGQGVMMAAGEHAEDDAQWREMISDPRGRRVLVTEARNPIGRAIAAALIAAGAHVFAGIAEAWRPFAPVKGAEIVPLDVTDEASVQRCAASIGGRVEIVVNTALSMRPRGDAIRARDEMETAYFGLMRLGAAFGPALCARAADGTHPACAWVNILSVYALAPRPGWSGSAAQAAALSVSRQMRGQLRPIRVVQIFAGPIDDEWHGALPPPKVAPSALAQAVIAALRSGVEEVVVGDVAADIVARWRADATALMREMEDQT